jgi:predicted RNA polymerase sigma factor
MVQPPASIAIDAIYRKDARRVFATLVRLLGSFDLAEEALHDAFRASRRLIRSAAARVLMHWMITPSMWNPSPMTRPGLTNKSRWKTTGCA